MGLKSSEQYMDTTSIVGILRDSSWGSACYCKQGVDLDTAQDIFTCHSIKSTGLCNENNSLLQIQGPNVDVFVFYSSHLDLS